MAKELKQLNKSFKLFYFVQTRSMLVFEKDLKLLGDSVHFHIDNEVATHCNLAGELSQANLAHHVYVCGPQGFMNFVIQTAQQ